MSIISSLYSILSGRSLLKFEVKIIEVCEKIDILMSVTAAVKGGKNALKGRERACKGCESECKASSFLLKAMRVFLKSLRSLVQALKVLVKGCECLYRLWDF